MGRLLICILFISFFAGVFGNYDIPVKEEASISDVQSDYGSTYYESEQDYICVGMVPEKIITDTNLLTGHRKSYLSFDYLSIETTGIKVFLEDLNLAGLILKDNLFLSTLLI